MTTTIYDLEMTYVIVGGNPEVAAMIARRQALGQDGHDEVWEGVYHMAPHAHPHHAVIAGQVGYILFPRVRSRGLVFTPELNLGDHSKSYRVPGFAVHASVPDTMYVPTALLVGEVLSPDDETYEKFDYYAAHGVQEIVVIDPTGRTVEAHRLVDGKYQGSDRIECADLSCADLAAQIDWP